MNTPLLLAIWTPYGHGFLGGIVALIIAVICLALLLYVIKACAEALGYGIPAPIWKLLCLLALVIAVIYALAAFGVGAP